MFKKTMVFNLALIGTLSWGMESSPSKDWSDAIEIDSFSWHEVGQKYKHVMGEYVVVDRPQLISGQWNGSLRGTHNNKNFHILYTVIPSQKVNEKIIYPFTFKVKEGEQKIEGILVAFAGKLFMHPIFSHDDPIDLSEFSSTDHIPEIDAHFESLVSKQSDE